MKRRIGTAVLALLLAALGTAGVAAYVKQANNRALGGQRLENVYYAAQPIPAGTSASTAQGSGLARTEQVAIGLAPQGAVTSTASTGTLVTTAPIAQGEVLVQSMFGRAATTSGGLNIPAGDLAESFPFCTSQAVAGYIHPGSEVYVIYTSGGGSIGQNCSLNGQLSTKATTKMLPFPLQVLSTQQAPTAAQSSSGGTVGQGSSANGNQSTVMLTFALTPSEAESLFTVYLSGPIYLALPQNGSLGTTAAPQS